MLRTRSPRRRRRRLRSRWAHATAALAVLGVNVFASPARAAIEERPFLTQLDFPTNMAFTPDGRLFFTEKNTGNVRIVSRGGRLQARPFTRFPVDATATETGMLGIALHPAFERRPWVYLYFSDAESGRNVLVRVPEADGRSGEPQLLRSFLPWSAGYHNGGDLLFGPDGMLYVAVGEGHDASRAQDPDDVGGKVLRLEPDGTIPPDNPIDGSAAYTIGHRNSFGLCVDPATGDIWETENGPDVDDEVNVLRAGENYGWPEVTGDSGGRFADPVVVFPRPEALTGCAVWRGELWFGAANTGVVYRMPLDRRGIAPREAASFDGAVTDLAVGPDGALYVATNAAIHRLTDDSATTTDAPTETGTETRRPASPTVAPGPVEMPTPDDRDGSVPAAVPVGAAVVLAIALWMRLRVARSVGRSLDEGDPPGRS